ncbi:helix-turn-helix domain-containing protein [Algoriphagus machipongonensis]|uniref:Transcriptional regulator, AraC family n=1 Tax=Algoriphagus machipongonensis TaxID=388413 RepID=A3HUP3_9BACT|nr:helix-turn-helix domain-containing protein [Algoriphagus machipongonensis]EAZ81865.1 putative transcriptional regulator, AraC family [Algoriphagus machipongonensis]
MQLELNFFNIIYLLSCSIGFILGLVLLTFGIKRKSTSILLGLSFLFLSYAILLAGLIDSGLIIHFPNLFRTGNVAALIYSFLPFVYIQYSLFQPKFRVWHLIHLLPAMIFIIDFMPVFLLDTADKVAMISSQVNDPSLIVSYTQSRFFPDNFHTEFRTILISIYWIISVILVWKYKNKNPQLGNKQILFRWIQTYLFFQLIIIAPFYLTFQSSNSDLAYKAVHFSGALMNLGTGIFLLYFPNILYGTNFYRKKSSAFDKEDFQTSKDEKSVEIDHEKAEELSKTLDELLKTQKVYLRKGYSVYDLAKDSGIPHYLLSQFMNQHLGVSFPEFINKARVIHSCELLDQAQTENYTLEAIGELSGFSNRNSFSSAFKKVTGKSPSVYLKERGSIRDEG